MFAEWLEARRGYLSGWRAQAPRRSGIRVFRYHGVVEAKVDPVLDRNQHLVSVFRAHVEYLRRFRVLGMDELVEELRTPENSRQPAAMVTFDDGFANNVLAAEILARRRIPWCLFVPSGEIGPCRAMWPVELSLLLLRGRAERIQALGRSWSLSGRGERERAFQEMRALLKRSIAAPQRREELASLREQFPPGESERLVAEFPSLRMLTWDELAQLSGAGVEIGSHGCHHELHNSVQPEVIRKDELARSRIDLEARLGRPCRAFAYPNGDFLDTSAQEAERAGYALAFTTRTATINGANRAEPFLLPRISAAGSLHSFARDCWWDRPRAAPPDAARVGTRA